MSPTGRLAWAAAIAVTVASSHAVYRAWPAWHGREISLPAALVEAAPVGLGYVGIEIPSERLALDTRAPGDAPHTEGDFERVRVIGTWWTPSSREAAWRIQGRTLYVQVEPDDRATPGYPPVMRPVSVSNAPVEGAINLAAIVHHADAEGRIRVSVGSHQIPAPVDIVARGKPPECARDANGPRRRIDRPADPGVVAILRVLPSGRAGLVALVIDGRRVGGR